jgi:anti-sigma B factor antagonist
MSVFQVDVSTASDGSPLVSVQGAITAETTGALSETLYRVVEERPQQVFVDLSKTGYIASPGLGALVSLLRKVKQHNGDLILRGLNEEVLEIFQLTHLDSIFTIVDADGVPHG